MVGATLVVALCVSASVKYVYVTLVHQCPDQVLGDHKGSPYGQDTIYQIFNVAIIPNLKTLSLTSKT